MGREKGREMKDMKEGAVVPKKNDGESMTIIMIIINNINNNITDHHH